MAIFRRKPAVEQRDQFSTTPPSWTSISGSVYGSYTNRPVTVDLAFGLPAVYAVVRTLSEQIGSLPIRVYRKQPDGSRLLAEDSSLYRLIASPNPTTPAGELWETVAAHLALWGNAYLWKERDDSGLVTALWPVRPSRVRVGRDKDNNRIYQVLPANTTSGIDVATSFAGTERDFLHIRNFGIDGLFGLSPIGQVRQAFGVHLAQQEYIGRFYANGATPSGLITLPSELTDEDMDRLKRDWNAAHAGLANAAKTIFLEDGAGFQPLDLPLADQQFIDQRQFGIREICSIYGVPPWIIGQPQGDSQTYANVEQQALHFVMFGLRTWANRISRALEHDGDISIDSTLCAEFDLNHLLKADSVARSQYLFNMVKMGAFSPNDAREFEGYNPVDGLDFHTQNFMPNHGTFDVPSDSTDEPTLEDGTDGA